MNPGNHLFLYLLILDLIIGIQNIAKDLIQLILLIIRDLTGFHFCSYCFSTKICFSIVLHKHIALHHHIFICILSHCSLSQSRFKQFMLSQFSYNINALSLNSSDFNSAQRFSVIKSKEHFVCLFISQTVKVINCNRVISNNILYTFRKIIKFISVEICPIRSIIHLNFDILWNTSQCELPMDKIINSTQSLLSIQNVISIFTLSCEDRSHGIANNHAMD